MSTSQTHPKYITDGSRLLEVYDTWESTLHCIDTSTEVVELVKHDQVRTTKWAGEEGDGKRWWPITD